MTLGLVPIPASVVTGDGAFVVTSRVRITGDADAAALLQSRIHRRAGFAPDIAPDGDIRLAVSGSGAPESYRLRVSTAGASIEAADAAGLQHGVHTLAQLLAAQDDAWVWPTVEIDDAPRFAHRGLMLDVARHFFAVDVVERLIDRMVGLKLNVLHLHLSDDQGWRLALSSRPLLAEHASRTAALGDTGGVYTRAEWERLLAHAASRQVTVIPEFDVPGHTHAVGLAYPELAQPPRLSPEIEQTAAEFGGGIPTPGRPYTGFAVGFSSLRIGEPATSAFLRDVFSELATLTPGPFVHVGGDEALGTSPEDYAAAIGEVTGLVAATGKTPIAWHEAGSSDSSAAGTVGQYWGFVRPTDGADEKARAFVRRGGRLILSPADAIYLDMKDAPETVLGLTWANGPTSIEQAYDWEPLDVVGGVAEADVLGVEAALWTETIRTEADIEAMVFPRLAAAAEIAWSRADARSWHGFRERLATLAAGWDADGEAYTRLAGIPWRTA